jgi:hypothetical protein
MRGAPAPAPGPRGFVHPDDMPAPDPPREGGKPLTGKHIQRLLEANSGGSVWVETKKNTWITIDTKRSAFILSEGDLCIVTAEFILEDMKNQKAKDPERDKEAERIEGF